MASSDDVRVEGEAADDEQVEAHALDRFLGGLLHLLRADGAVLRADGDGHAPRLAVGVGVFPVGVEPGPGVGLQAVELEALVLDGVLHARLPQVVQDHGGEVLLPRWASCSVTRAVHVLVAVASTRCGDRLSTVKGPVTRMRLLSS